MMIDAQAIQPLCKRQKQQYIIDCELIKPREANSMTEVEHYVWAIRNVSAQLTFFAFIRKYFLFIRVIINLTIKFFLLINMRINKFLHLVFD